MNNSRTPAQTLAIAVGVALIIAAISTAIYFDIYEGPVNVVKEGEKIVNKAADDSIDKAKRIADEIDKWIHVRPQITIREGPPVVEGSRPIAEFSTIEKSFTKEYTFEADYLGSTKRLQLKGHFIAKAGYDFTQPFSIKISDDGATVHATLPPAKINSIEQTKIEILQDQDGWWNKITPKERQTAMNALTAKARESIEATTALSDADAAMMSYIDSAVRKNSPPTVSILRDSPPLQ